MTKSCNDATLQKIGDIYQYLIALRTCFELEKDDTMQLETNGDVSLISDTLGKYQMEVKHHFKEKSITTRDIDFWKTLANWYKNYEHIKNYTKYILYTTAKITKTSPFYDWNISDKEKKLEKIKEIGGKTKKREKLFRTQFKRIFDKFYDEEHLLEILDKFIIEPAKTKIDGISNEFTKYVGHIPIENRDSYIGALLGEIMIKVKNPPHKWGVNKDEFEKILQRQTAAYGIKNAVPLPTEYAKTDISKEDTKLLEQKKFVLCIREIEYDKMISSAVSDYWKTNMTIAKYFTDNPIYLDSLDLYKDELNKQMIYAKEKNELNVEESTEEKQLINISKQLYLEVMKWNVNDFGSIIQNQGFFQRGVIHDIVNETDFRWKVGNKNEHK